MPPRTALPRGKPSAEERAQAMIADEIERFSDAIAAEMGPASGARNVSIEHEARLFWQKDPLVDFDTLYTQMTTTGVPMELLDPENPDALEIIRYEPRFIEYLSGPVAPEVAGEVAPLVEFPLRHGILMSLKHDPRTMVAKTKRLYAMEHKVFGTTPLPEPPPQVAPVPVSPPLPAAPAAAMAAPVAPDPTMLPLPMGGQ